MGKIRNHLVSLAHDIHIHTLRSFVALVLVALCWLQIAFLWVNSTVRELIKQRKCVVNNIQAEFTRDRAVSMPHSTPQEPITASVNTPALNSTSHQSRLKPILEKIWPLC